VPASAQVLVRAQVLALVWAQVPVPAWFSRRQGNY
jgi:hypothetical protein